MFFPKPTIFQEENNVTSVKPMTFQVFVPCLPPTQYISVGLYFPREKQFWGVRIILMNNAKAKRQIHKDFKQAQFHLLSTISISNIYLCQKQKKIPGE